MDFERPHPKIKEIKAYQLKILLFLNFYKGENSRISIIQPKIEDNQYSEKTFSCLKEKETKCLSLFCVKNLRKTDLKTNRRNACNPAATVACGRRKNPALSVHTVQEAEEIMEEKRHSQ